VLQLEAEGSHAWVLEYVALLSLAHLLKIKITFDWQLGPYASDDA